MKRERTQTLDLCRFAASVVFLCTLCRYMHIGYYLKWWGGGGDGLGWATCLAWSSQAAKLDLCRYPPRQSDQSCPSTVVEPIPEIDRIHMRAYARTHTHTHKPICSFCVILLGNHSPDYILKLFYLYLCWCVIINFAFQTILEYDLFHKSLFALCVEIVLFSYNSQSRSAPSIPFRISVELNFFCCPNHCWVLNVIHAQVFRKVHVCILLLGSSS